MLAHLTPVEFIHHHHLLPISSMNVTQANRLTIGKSEIHGEGQEKNDFEIDGMGINERHCVLNYTPAVVSEMTPEQAAAAAEAAGEGEEEEKKSGAGGEEGGGGGGGGAVLELCSEDAVVHVNGEVLHGVGAEGAMRLKHLDRVILGPCRVIAVFLERKLTPSEKASLTYQAAFREFMTGDDDASRLMMSPARQELLDRVSDWIEYCMP
jgi:hypothetical protein